MALSPEDEAIRQRLLAIVHSIPKGKVESYGGVGGRCDPAVSGYICGRYLGRGAGDAPWWRVVAKDGTLSVARRSPEAAAEQRTRLEEEGVRFGEDGKVARECFWE